MIRSAAHRASHLSRTRLALALSASLLPAFAHASEPASGGTAPEPLPLAAPEAAAQDTPPASDPRHAQDSARGRHAKDLDTVIVTATPLRDTASELSKPVDVLAGERLDEERGATLGETISSIPGVQSSNFGPGVGRPILRGLDGARVAILTGGMVTQDVSTVSQDHSPTIEPFLADQIEVLKGPSTLLYGSGAIGGVVNVVDGRIPEAPIPGGFSGRAEMRFDSVSRGNTDMVRVDGGTDTYALHADAVYRNNKDYDTPNGKQDNSFIDTKTGSVGGSLLGDWGFVGLSAARFEDDYGNPGEPGDLRNGERGVFLRLRQDRYDLKGGLTEPFGEGSGLRYSFGHTSYNHIEFENDQPGTTFTKNANEGRVEATFTLGSGWQTAVGAQGSATTFAAVGEESFVPKTSSREAGIFGVARNAWDDFQLDLGARVDKIKREPDGSREVKFTPVSASIGGGYKINDQFKLTANLDHAERAPAEEELFADGPHLATLAYEVGNRNLNKEASNQFEIGVQYQSALVDAKVSAYYNRFKDFVYLVDTGTFFPFDEGPLPIRQWSQSDANFRGYEGEATFHLAEGETGRWDLRAFGDTVRAKLANGGGNVPRIAPSRIGAQLRWDLNGWRASVGATRYARQDKVAVNETPTDGYTLVDAHLSYHIDSGRMGYEVFLDGSNLTDQVARVHTSFLKDDVVLPGRSVAAGLRVFF